jgi:hypothetical protein
MDFAQTRRALFASSGSEDRSTSGGGMTRYRRRDEHGKKDLSKNEATKFSCPATCFSSGAIGDLRHTQLSR